jgi:hypothetical protein
MELDMTAAEMLITFRHFKQIMTSRNKKTYFRTRRNVTWNWADPTTEGIRPAFSNNPGLFTKTRERYKK